MRMFRPLLLAALVALPLGGCAMQSDGPGGAMAMGDMTPNGRTAYVQMAAASDLFEIQSSNLARTRSQNAEVRQFAEMLVTHHTQMTAQLMAAASAAGVQPAPMLMPMQARMMTELQAASGSGFDRLYMSQQVQAHEMALALHSNYARNGDTVALGTVASAATPIVQQHLDRARQLD
jgi:putative membrane protein